jgi:hypothetical protein
LQHVVQLHLSRDCNRPELARAAAQTALLDLQRPPELHTAQQQEPTATLTLGFSSPRPRTIRRRSRPASVSAARQLWLPGFEND